MERKKLIQVLIAFGFAAVFILSYSTIFDVGGVVTTSTTTALQGTAYSFGFANAPIVGYAPIMNITIKCSNSSVSGAVSYEVSNVIGNLEGNNSIGTYYGIHNNITVEAGDENTFQIYNYTYSNLNTTARNCSTFFSGAELLLPLVMNVSVGGQNVPIEIPNATRRPILPVTFTQNMNTTLYVRVAAFLTSNGMVAGNLSVTRAQV